MGLVSLLIALSSLRSPADTSVPASRVERRLAARMNTLEGYAEKVLQDDGDGWDKMAHLPPDMAIYRYKGDSLQSWAGRFSVKDDDIADAMMISRLASQGRVIGEPLKRISRTAGFYNFGPKWYIAKYITEGDVKVIYGLTILNELDKRSFTGVNPALNLSAKYSIRPLSYSGGSAVSLGGQPQFKILYESLTGSAKIASLWLLLAVGLILASLICYLAVKRNFKAFVAVSLTMAGLLALVYIWGMFSQNEYRLFSPALYADGPVFYSLGAVLVLNAFVTLLFISIYLIRGVIYRKSLDRRFCCGYICALPVVVGATLVFAMSEVSSIVRNSNISLEIYKYEDITVFSFLALTSLLLMLATVPLLAKTAKPAMRSVFGDTIGNHETLFRVAYSAIVSIAIVAIAASLGYKKEQSRLDVWAGKLSIDRDIPLEIQLRRVEERIANDPVIATLAVIRDGKSSILRRLAEVYFPNIYQAYDFDLTFDPSLIASLDGAEPIVPASHFLCSEMERGRPLYCGMFVYNVPGYGLKSITVSILSRKDIDRKGYASIFGIDFPGRTRLPSQYSYARYAGGRIISWSGTCPYPSLLPPEADRNELGSGYSHFVFEVAPDETVVISRVETSFVNYIVAAVSLTLILIFVSIGMMVNFRKRRKGQKLYYRKRITRVMMLSLWGTLVAISIVSVIFVYRRNATNLRNIMSDRINAIRSMVESRTMFATSEEGLKSMEMLSFLEDVGASTNTDITLYDTRGLAFMSTAPMAFENMMLPVRMSGEAYRNIMVRGQRYYIVRETAGGRSFFNMYVPISGVSGDTVAILCAPYADENYDFQKDAVNHAMFMMAVFLILLMISRFFSEAIADRIFRPLGEMGAKMTTTGIESLEEIEYDREDEISSLVGAYNRMVSQLRSSSAKLAQAEREKAWSGMARQVAHEIKNPLTPMKLQLQRIIRLKGKNDPEWQEKFDEVSKVILDHIDILTETANEFSTFAKLYTEEHTEINLDRMLEEEISMFDSKGDVEFEYRGLAGAVIMGPKPQLVRVIVNLLGNAVQAVSETSGGKVIVSLRNSSRRGYYDIVFEDNGPGVAEENREKLFTPNFTTKSGGSGLGLAISKSVLEQCGATISYSRSFELGGACFAINYPKPEIGKGN